MSGTLADPVRLDPWQLIRNVHWESIEYVAVELAVEIGGINTGSGDLCVGGPSLATQIEWYIWLTGSDYRWRNPSNPVINRVVRKKGGTSWTSPNPDPPVVSGVPSLAGASFSWGAHDKVGAAGSQTMDGGQAFVVSGPQPRVGPPSGTALDIEVPNKPGIFFTTALSAVMQHFGDVFTGGGGECFAGVQNYPCTGSTDPDHIYSSGSAYGDYAIDLAGLTATFKGRSFRAIGSRALLNVEEAVNGADANDFNIVWVLLARDDLV